MNSPYVYYTAVQDTSNENHDEYINRWNALTSKMLGIRQQMIEMAAESQDTKLAAATRFQESTCEAMQAYVQDVNAVEAAFPLQMEAVQLHYGGVPDANNEIHDEYINRWNALTSKMLGSRQQKIETAAKWRDTKIAAAACFRVAELEAIQTSEQAFSFQIETVKKSLVGATKARDAKLDHLNLSFLATREEATDG